MIPNTRDRELESVGVSDSGSFGISEKDSAHLMTILRETIYTDKIMAVIREYSANAWDAHRSVGKHAVPIKVTMPTAGDPNLTIRDFGPGLSKEDVFQVYTQYGASTKRGTDGEVGMLGIGSKSGFAYADSFTVTSWHGGMKRIFVAVLDKSEKGVMNLLHEEPCSVEETGVEIQIAVQQKDIEEFTTKAKRLYQHFDPRPDINLDLPPPPPSRTALKNGYIFKNEEVDYQHRGWVALMGCVPYRINIDELRGVGNGIGSYASSLSGVVYFDIGEVQINASREELKYSDSTKKTIVERISAVIDEFVLYVLQNINVRSNSHWERRLGAKILRDLKLDVPKEKQGLLDHTVFLRGVDPPKTFYFTGPKKMDRVEAIQVAAPSRLLLRDEGRSMIGYNLTRYDVIVRKLGKASWEDVEEELEELLEKFELTGITIEKLSNLPWVKPLTPERTMNEKHRKRCFTLNLPKGRSFRTVRSSNWDSAESDPPNGCVFVIIHSFEAYSGFEDHVREDRMICDLINEPFPTVYGFKDTTKKPITEKTIEQDLNGVEYREWRKGLREKLDTPYFRALLQLQAWARIVHLPRYPTRKRLTTRSVYRAGRYVTTYKRTGRRSGKRYAPIFKELGQYHPICTLIRTNIRASKELAFLPRNINSAVFHVLEDLIDIGKSEAAETVEDLAKRYPLLFKDPAYGDFNSNNLSALWREDELTPHWIQYVKLIDNHLVTKKEES